MPEARPDDCSCRLRLSIQPARLLLAMVLTAAVLAVLGFVVHTYLFLSGGPESARFGSTLTKLGVDYERSIPTWYNAALLMLGSVLLLFCFRAEARRGRATRYFWAGLAVLVLAMSVDEIAGFHENFHYIITRRTAFRGTGPFRYAWVLVGLPFAALVTLAAVPFLRRLRPRTAALLVASGAFYFGGALGLEMVAAYLRDLHDGAMSIGFFVATAFEELFEMVGAALLCYTALDFIRAEQTAPAPQPFAAAPLEPATARQPRASLPRLRRRPQPVEA